MDPADPLRRILSLEQSQGCRDRAVIGGLGAFAARWAGTASAVPAAVRADVAAALAGYGAAGAEARAAAVARALAALDGAAEAPRAPAADGRAGAPARRPAQRPAAAPPAFAPRASDDPALDQPVTTLPGVGPKLAATLERLGLRTVRDVLFHAPLRYQDFRHRARIADVRVGDEVTVAGRIVEVRRTTGQRVKDVVTVTIADASGRLPLVFFHQPYLASTLRAGDGIAASGRVERLGQRLGLSSPAWEALDRAGTHTGRLVPVYPLVAGLGQRALRRLVAATAERYAPCLGEPLPDDLRRAEGLPGRAEAVWTLHHAESPADVARARARLAFDELVALQLWARRRRRARDAQPAPDLAAGRPLQAAFVAALPFALTEAQRRCIDEIGADLARTTPMSRLLQGDVGSGKTAVAGAAVALCAGAGRQAAVMAPTEILAEQHRRGLGRTLEAIGFRPFHAGDGPAGAPTYARLVGSMRPAEKAAVADGLARGDIDVVIGTHALIQDRVAFARLGLAVVDEQHRFGVVQRAALAASVDGKVPHTLIMTATPIPRTLAHVLHADVDQSVLDELPPGRTPVRTIWLRPDERARAYAFVQQRVASGEQAFVVCPLVEDSERSDGPSATGVFEQLSAGALRDLRLGLLHGRMRPVEKEQAMQAFAAGDTQVLVATTVIEVGIDVPNATVILVDGADRFGLAQLHQLRGRVGRGAAPGTCLLLAEDPSRGAAERLAAIAGTSDGLALAERDLALRGPGDYFGTLQAGVADRFRFARLVGDPAPLAAAARVAQTVLGRDPSLADPAHAALRAAADAFAAGAERA